jgi:DNA-directed RNA polymerase subunit beta'
MRLRTGVRQNIDALTGLKENVIVDRLIPAGTGAVIGRLHVAAASRDAVRSMLQTEG